MTIDQDRCRSATHSLQQSHVDNIPPLSTASDARSSPLRAFSCPALASKPHGRARPLWRPSGAPAAASARGPWRGSARRPRAPGARGRGRGGRLHVLPCADEIDLAWTQGSREWLALETFIDLRGTAGKFSSLREPAMSCCASSLRPWLVSPLSASLRGFQGSFAGRGGILR